MIKLISVLFSLNSMPRLSASKKLTFKAVLDTLDKVPINSRMSGPEIKYFHLLSASLISGNDLHTRSPRPGKFTNSALKRAFTDLETLAQTTTKAITRKQALELWDFCGDMAQDGEGKSESDSDGSEFTDSESEDETPPPKPRGRPKGSKNKKKESDEESE